LNPLRIKSATIQKITSQFETDKAPLLQVLLSVQEMNPQRYISEEDIDEISQRLHVTRGRVYSTASFYSEISLKPRGIHLIRVCVNAPCENAGKDRILKTLIGELGIQIGQTTPDGLFTLESVNCLGACYMSPAIKVDDTIYGNLTHESVLSIIQNLKEEFQNDQAS
jgi:NADH:ubiquinone oxidoreductase subunit E